MIKQLKEIHKDIDFIRRVEVDKIVRAIRQHDLGNAQLVCTFVDINLGRQLDMLKGIIDCENMYKSNKRTLDMFMPKAKDYPCTGSDKSLNSIAHPTGDLVNEDADINPESLETIEIDVPITIHLDMCDLDLLIEATFKLAHNSCSPNFNPVREGRILKLNQYLCEKRKVIK